MAYQTYTTDALVCGSFDRNTADRVHLLFTRDAGMLYADARSVRSETSKQRYALQDFSFIRVSLVKGKRGWRIGSVEPLKNAYFGAQDRKSRGMVVRVVRFLRRYVHGDDVPTSIFDDVEELLLMKELNPETLKYAIILIEYRILYALGYIEHTSKLSDCVNKPLAELVSSGAVEYQALQAAVDTAGDVSHL